MSQLVPPFMSALIPSYRVVFLVFRALHHRAFNIRRQPARRRESSRIQRMLTLRAASTSKSYAGRRTVVRVAVAGNIIGRPARWQENLLDRSSQGKEPRLLVCSVSSSHWAVARQAKPKSEQALRV